MDVGGGMLSVRGSHRQEPDGRGLRHHHPHVRRDPLDPLIVGERCNARPQELIAALERGPLLDRPAHARAELQHLDLHRDDPGEHHAEQRDPRAAPDDPVEQRVVRQAANDGERTSGDRVAAVPGGRGPGSRCAARARRGPGWLGRYASFRRARDPSGRGRGGLAAQCAAMTVLDVAARRPAGVAAGGVMSS